VASPADLIRRTSVLLNDQEAGHEYTTWTVPMLLDFYNEAMCTIFALRPTLFSKPVTLTLSPGSTQTLPPEYGQLLSITTNTTDGAGCTPEGAPVTMSAFNMVAGLGKKAKCVGAGSCTPYAVSSYRAGEAGEGVFSVEPPVPCGEDAKVNALVTVRPPKVSRCDVNDPADMPCEMDAPIIDYMLWRAYSIDAESQFSYAAARRHQATFYDWINGSYLVASRMASGYYLGRVGHGEARVGWRNEGKVVGR